MTTEKNHMADAAPDLYQSTELLLQFVDSIMPQVGNLACDIGLLNDALIQGRRAIAKANGNG